MKLFTKKQIEAAEKYTCLEQSISKVDLMERAGEQISQSITSDFKESENIFIFCGNGNNGGDGFVAARLLHHRFFKVKVFIDFKNEKYSEAAQYNLSKIRKIEDLEIFDFSDIKNFKIEKSDLIIDAIFGIGLNRKLSDESAEIIGILNKIDAVKISVDIPSGLLADEMTPIDFPVFRADNTYSFQFWKTAFLYPETGNCCGEIKILNIGISEQWIEQEYVDRFISDDILVKSIYKKREDFSNKGTFGNSVLIAGSYGKIGAAVLATKASLRSGSGLTFTIAPGCGYAILQSLAPEAMFIKGGENHITTIDLPKNAVCGIGPGIGTDKETSEIVLKFLKIQKKPLVIDADALNIISQNRSTLNSIPENSILTPHPKEFARLFGESENSYEQAKLARKMAATLKIIIILKGHHTKVFTPDQKVFFNNTGNSGMAKGGSGDVLTGILTALLSENYDPVKAAIFGVWLHGKSGDISALQNSKESMSPTDLINNLGKVFNSLNN
ncbi:NAD(P)H-hydrate dehydratase [Halpernia sp. GG3]